MAYQEWRTEKKDENTKQSNVVSPTTPTTTSTPAASPTPTDAFDSTTKTTSTDKGKMYTTMFPDNNVYTNAYVVTYIGPSDSSIAKDADNAEYLKGKNFTMRFQSAIEALTLEFDTVSPVKDAPNFMTLSRGKVKGDSDRWAYTSTVKTTGTCFVHYTIDKYVNAPCGDDVSRFTYPTDTNGSVGFITTCNAKEESGLKACDDVIRSIKITNKTIK